jgi:hypothetical protein
MMRHCISIWTLKYTVEFFVGRLGCQLSASLFFVLSSSVELLANQTGRLPQISGFRRVLQELVQNRLER